MRGCAVESPKSEADCGRASIFIEACRPLRSDARYAEIMFFGGEREAVLQLPLMWEDDTLLSLTSDLTSPPLTHDKLDGPDIFFINHKFERLGKTITQTVT